MVNGPRPLQEKLTLFWHGHFATSTQKVREAYFMWLQNETFRRHAMGNWLQLLTAVAKDPAMLIWLDQAESRKEHPNENFAREVMELFALGEGHYTEQDITEAARALTGWSLNRVQQKFEYRSAIHDPGLKTVLGRSGNLPPPMMTSNCLRQLGQDLLAPPNVKGWDGGVAWITTNNLLNRYNFASVLVLGRNAMPAVLAAADRKERA